MVRRTVPSLGREGLGELLGEVRGRQRHSVYSGDRGMESSRRQSSTIGAVSPRMVLIALTSLVSIGSRQPGVSDALPVRAWADLPNANAFRSGSWPATDPS